MGSGFEFLKFQGVAHGPWGPVGGGAATVEVCGSQAVVEVAGSQATVEARLVEWMKRRKRAKGEYQKKKRKPSFRREEEILSETKIEIDRNAFSYFTILNLFSSPGRP